MTFFTGTVGNDIANAAIGELTGFTGGSVADLGDGVGDHFDGGDGDDFVFAANANDTIEGGEGNDALNGGEGNDVIYGNTGPNPAGSLIGDEIVGNIGNDTLHGANGDDVMDGGEGHDNLFGRQGADTLRGGEDDDTYFFLGDQLHPGETNGDIIDDSGGFDIIRVLGSVTFANAVVISGIEAIELVGTTATFTASQMKTSLPASLLIDGSPTLASSFFIEMGADTTLDVGGLTLVNWGANNRFEIFGDGDDEVIAGTAQIDSLFGNGGDDTLVGNGGVDQLFGGLGNDVYLVDQAAGEAFEFAGHGNDTVLALFSYILPQNVENLTLLGTGPINGTGNELANTIVGNSGANFLDGGAGVDSLQGGLGNDTYLVDNAGDVVSEAAGAGTDTVQASVNYTLAAGLQVETLMTTIPGGTINLTGNALSQQIIGNAGANTLKDGGGAGDALKGLAGSDTYLVYSSATSVAEAASGGTADRIAAAVDFALGAGVHVELLNTTSLSGTSGIDLTGNALKQSIAGNAGANVLHDGGAGAADTLSGLGGNDTYRVFNSADVIVEASTQGALDRVTAAVDYKLGAGVHVEYFTTNGSSGTSAIDLTGNEVAQQIVGNAGDNRLEGKGGSDTLTGLLGDDTFVFATALGAGNIDTVTDFNVADDRFLLSNAIFTALATGTLSAAAFRANTTGLAQDSSDRIIYETDTGELYYDANGNAAGGSLLFAKVAVGLSLTNADFSVA